MTELAYMTLEEWGQGGAGVESQSARIRDWLGDPPYAFATADIEMYRGHSTDRLFVEELAPAPRDRVVVSIDKLVDLNRLDEGVAGPITVLRPLTDGHCDLVAQLVRDKRVERVFVLINHDNSPFRSWLDAHGALRVHTGTVAAGPSAVVLEAAKSIQSVEYNGLSSGDGKSVVVQLVRAFAEHGYPVDPELWAKAYFVVGGKFRHAAVITKLVSEMQRGVKHRVTPQYRDNIFEILLERSNREPGRSTAT